MDIIMTDTETGMELVLPMLPENVKCALGSNFQTYDVIQMGEVKIPNGKPVNEISWSGTLPGMNRDKCDYMRLWRAPSEILDIWRGWKNNGTIVRLMVTNTIINCDMYISQYTAEYTGGFGNYEYDITFIEARCMRVGTVAEMSPSQKGGNGLATRPAPSSSKTYTVKKGDSLWTISKKLLGSGARYTELYQANKDKIKDPNKIYQGQILTIPG